MRSMYNMAILIIIFMVWGCFEASYRSTLKYYPDLTRMEYIFLYDKLRITNESSKDVHRMDERSRRTEEL